MDLSPARVARYGRAGGRWARLLTSRHPAPGLRVFYGHDRIPKPDEPARGGTAKFQRLKQRFPSSPTSFTLLYLGSSWLPRDLRPLLWLARRRGVPVVLNQNGVGYPAWAGEETGEVNRPLRTALRAADHVLYQSEFCKRSADLFLGEPRGSWEILPNAVDAADRFTPAVEPPEAGPVLLLAGDQLQPYRLELALRTFALVRGRHPEARMIVSGRHAVPAEPLLDALGLGSEVELVGPYSQADAPALYRRAHLLLHTTVNDSCPSVVIEAMACGLPVVHPASGGTVELVGDEGGIGVPHAESWDVVQPPAPDALAEAVDRVLGELPVFAAAARRRAVERFALEPWLERHAELFAELLGLPAPPALQAQAESRPCGSEPQG
jgi:glycosyltransferase involved in cell wall biosynthesis